MPHESAPGVHTLLRVADVDALQWGGDRPEWALRSLQRAPFVVVRRAMPRVDAYAVGVRGSARYQRAAAWLPVDAVRECITPQMLVARRAWHRPAVKRMTPAIAALDAVAGIFDAHGVASLWGPSGSAGFELASRLPATTPCSDLDVVLSMTEPLAPPGAARLHADLSRLPVRVDVLIETPYGAVVLAEYMKGGGKILLRSAHGPRFVLSPWSSDVTAQVS